MAETKVHPLLNFLILLVVFICCCETANVQFYWQHDFKGAVYEATSITSCQDLPISFANLNGSVRTTGCIVVFQLPSCDEKYNDNYGFLVKSEEKRLSELPWKYEDGKYSGYTVSSYRVCTDLEKRPQVDVDLFERENFKGKVAQFRNVCSCTNLKHHGITYRSAKTYGNCFKMYPTTNCDGASTHIRHNTQYFYISSAYRSIKPCYPPQVQCNVRFNAILYWIETKSDISSPPTILEDVTIVEKQVFFNNGSSQIEHYFETKREISETLQFQLYNAIHSINEVTLSDWLSLDLGPNIPSHLQNQTEAIIQAFKSNETVVKRELNVQENFTLLPCTKLEVKWFAEIAEFEIDFNVHFGITATTSGSKRIEAKLIRHYFERLNFSEDFGDFFTAVTETTAKFRLRFTNGTRVNVTTEPILDCQQRYTSLKAQVTYISPITEFTNLTRELEKFPISNTRTFINNGSIQQLKYYEAEMEVEEIGQFHFSNELNEITSVGFHKDLLVEEMPLIPFLTNVWTKLKSGKMSQEENETISDSSFIYIVRSNKTCQVEEKIAIPPCTKYDVGSFVKVKNVEIGYKIQLQVTGQQLSQSMDVEKIRENLQGLTYVRNEDNFTVVVETTGKLMLNYVVGTGINAVGTPIPECYERYGTTVANCKVIN